jgi:hypothetical protein
MADSNSTSFSSSFPETTPASQWDLALSQIAEQLGQQTYNWAQGVYGKTSAMTDQLINDFQTQANSNMGNANALMGQYNNLAPGQIGALVQDANTYASTPRIQEAMGAAESATGQAMDQGRINAEQNLQSYGIDPSSGRYAELEQAQRAASSAAQAGAGQEAELATEQTGRNLRAQAIGALQQIPGQAVNFVNSAIGATQGASSANIGTAQAGAQLMDTASPYMADAANLKYPPNASMSTSSQQSSSGSGSGGGSGGGGSGGGGGSDDGSGGGGNSGSENDYAANADSGNYMPGGNGADSFASDDGTVNMGASDDSGGIGASDSGFAAGGGVLPSPTTGGHVPIQASPSMGQNTDDVNARLNAGEFVVPRDVAAWKGQEFFQKLIDESRRKRLGAPAKGKPKPALGGPPRFQSHPIPPQGQPQMGAQ